MTGSRKVRTCLWFDSQALEAAEFYCSLLPDSRVENLDQNSDLRDDPKQNKILIVEFILAGAPFMALNGGPVFTHSEAASISVLTDDQEETDRLWAALTADGGSESMCGWLKDRFGVSWQITPKRLIELASGPHAEQVSAAMMEMKKIDIAGLEAAAKA